MQEVKPLVEEINQYLTLLNNEQQKAVLITVKDFATREQRRSKYQLLQSNIHEFASLQPNWDTYAADAISQKAIESAVATLDFLQSEKLLSGILEVNVFPMRNGGIQFEFDSSNTSSELEIDSGGQLTLLSFDKNGNVVNRKSIIELSQLTVFIEAQPDARL